MVYVSDMLAHVVGAAHACMCTGIWQPENAIEWLPPSSFAFLRQTLPDTELHHPASPAGLLALGNALSSAPENWVVGRHHTHLALS